LTVLPKKWSFNKFLKNKFDAEDFYALIDFHTHPNGSASPSIVDLNGLRFQKKHNYSGDLNVSPIGVVAGVNKNERYVPLLLFQENDEEIGKVFDDNGNLMAHSSRFMSNEEFEQAFYKQRGNQEHAGRMLECSKRTVKSRWDKLGLDYKSNDIKLRDYQEDAIKVAIKKRLVL